MQVCTVEIILKVWYGYSCCLLTRFSMTGFSVADFNFILTAPMADNARVLVILHETLGNFLPLRYLDAFCKIFFPVRDILIVSKEE